MKVLTSIYLSWNWYFGICQFILLYTSILQCIPVYTKWPISILPYAGVRDSRCHCVGQKCQRRYKPLLWVSWAVKVSVLGGYTLVTLCEPLPNFWLSVSQLENINQIMKIVAIFSFGSHHVMVTYITFDLNEIATTIDSLFVICYFLSMNWCVVSGCAESDQEHVNDVVCLLWDAST